jgi:hypothetical protein
VKRKKTDPLVSLSLTNEEGIATTLKREQSDRGTRQLCERDYEGREGRRRTGGVVKAKKKVMPGG